MIRTTSKIKCPVCGRFEDGCLVAQDGDACICVRTPSGKKCGAAGWLHRISISPLPDDCRQRPKMIPANINWSTLQHLYVERYCGRKFPDLGSGWDGEAVTIPMYNADKVITGMQRVFSNGDKRFVNGSEPGVFLPTSVWRNGLSDPVVVTEGVSDTQTAVDLGCCVLGRSSCNHGIKVLTEMLHTSRVIVIPDNDPAGMSGGNELALALADAHIKVCMLVPPQQGWDLTDWVKAYDNDTIRRAIHDFERTTEGLSFT